MRRSSAAAGASACGRAGRRQACRWASAGGHIDGLVTCVDTCAGSHGDVQVTCAKSASGSKNTTIHIKVVKNPFSWGFHFSAYSVCPDKSFWRGKKSS